MKKNKLSLEYKFKRFLPSLLSQLFTAGHQERSKKVQSSMSQFDFNLSEHSLAILTLGLSQAEKYYSEQKKSLNITIKHHEVDGKNVPVAHVSGK